MTDSTVLGPRVVRSRVAVLRVGGVEDVIAVRIAASAHRVVFTTVAASVRGRGLRGAYCTPVVCRRSLVKLGFRTGEQGKAR